LVCAPEIPETIGHNIAGELSRRLEERLDGGVRWEVPLAVDPLSGSEREAPPRYSTPAARGGSRKAGT
jgi:hypothetical protein